jgi:putative NADH-flavin reductase
LRWGRDPREEKGGREGMRLAIFGASGRTGRPLVERALAEGREVRALVRSPSGFPVSHDRLVVVEGDVLDAARVEEIVAETDAVLSVLGPTKTSPKDVMTRGMQNIVGAMEKHDVRRLVSLTGAGVRDPRDEPKLVDRVFVFLLKRLQPDVLADSERRAELIRGSDPTGPSCACRG